jgi:hypothetical protein
MPAIVRSESSARANDLGARYIHNRAIPRFLGNFYFTARASNSGFPY